MSKSKNEITIQISEQLFEGVRQLIDAARKKVAIHVNAATTQLYWEVGHYINVELLKENRAEFGKRILRNLSDQLTQNYGKGFTYTSLTRMCKVAKIFDESIVATLSQQLSWSHLVELIYPQRLTQKRLLHLNVHLRKMECQDIERQDWWDVI